MLERDCDVDQLSAANLEKLRVSGTRCMIGDADQQVCDLDAPIRKQVPKIFEEQMAMSRYDDLRILS